MNAAQDDGPRCPRCRAPVSRSGGRCQLCGSPVAGPDGAVPFDPALVGTTEQRRARERANTGRQPEDDDGTGQGLSKAGMVLAALLAMVAVGVVIFMVSRKPARVPEQPAQAPSALAAAAASAAAPLNVNGIEIASATSVDPTDLLPAVKRRLSEQDRTLSLLGIEVIGARQGVVNLQDAGASIVYRFLASPERPRMQREAPPPPEVMVLSLSLDPPAISRAAATAQHKAVIEPTCVWSAAWRAAVASGLSDSEPFDATFATNSTSGANSWVFTPKNRPEASHEVDGQSCAIKTR